MMKLLNARCYVSILATVLAVGSNEIAGFSSIFPSPTLVSKKHPHVSVLTIHDQPWYGRSTEGSLFSKNTYASGKNGASLVMLDAEGSTGDRSPQPRRRKNLRALGRVSFSGLLAYGYMKYWAIVSIASSLFYVFQKTAGKRSFKSGEWVMLLGIFAGLIALSRIMGPAKFVLELVVTSFFSYFFISLAQGDL